MYIIFKGCSLISKIDVKEYQDYLENKYGKDKGFYMVEQSDCNWFELGTCSYLFSAADLNGQTFEITGEVSSRGNIFYEQYIGAKYNKDLEEYYRNLLSNVFNFNYTINISTNYDNIDPDISFDDYLKYDKLDLGITINTNNDNINITSIESEINNIIYTNQIKNVSLIILRVDRCDDKSNSACFDNYTIYKKINNQ